MRHALALTAVLSLCTPATAQNDAESPDENRPAEAPEHPDLPPAPPDTTTDPAVQPDEPSSSERARDDSTDADRQNRPPRDLARPADRVTPENEWDARFGARFETNADGRFVVRSVAEQSLAARTGLRADDVLLSIDGLTFDTETDLRFYLRSHANDRIPITVLRDGAEQTVYLQNGGERGFARPALGVRFLRGPYLEVISVVQGSPADQAGIVPGDFIVSMNGAQFASTDAFLSAVADADVDDDVELVFNRHGEIIVATTRLDAWNAVYDSSGTTVMALRPDLDSDVDFHVSTPRSAYVPAHGCGSPDWTGHYHAPVYAGPYFYAPFSGPIYYGPAYTYWPAHVSWRYPGAVYHSYIW